MSKPEDVVFEFFESIEHADYQTSRAAFADRITDGCQWANTGFPTAVGKQACLELWDAFHESSSYVGLRAEMIYWAARDDTVVTERVDHLFNAAGENFLSIPLAGTLVVRDGKIAAWRDYWDPRPFLS